MSSSDRIHILSLPGEIRNQIYNYLFLLPAPSTHRTLGDPPIHASILSTCRKIHDEGIQILYGGNTFLAHPCYLTGLPRLRLYYSTITSAHLISLITKYHIRVRLDCDPNFTREKAAAAFSGKEEITIEVFQAAFGSCDEKVLRLFEDVRGVKKARIYGSIILFPDYTKWLEQTIMADEGVERIYERIEAIAETIKSVDAEDVTSEHIESAD